MKRESHTFRFAPQQRCSLQQSKVTCRFTSIFRIRGRCAFSHTNTHTHTHTQASSRTRTYVALPAADPAASLDGVAAGVDVRLEVTTV